MFGRRDRCLLVLSQLAGVPYKHLAAFTAGDVTLTAGTVRVETLSGAWMVAPDPDPVVCGPCAVVRWLRVLNLIVTRPGKRTLAQALKKVKAVTSTSPHLCRSTRDIDQLTMTVPLLPPIDQWGYLPFPVQRLTPHSLSRRARDLLGGASVATRPAGRLRHEPGTPASAPPPGPEDRVQPEGRAAGVGAPPRRPGRHRRYRGRPEPDRHPGEGTATTNPLPSWLRKPATNHHPAKGLLTSDVACRHPCHRRPEPGPCAMPLHLAVPMDHPGHGITSTPTDRRAGRDPSRARDSPAESSEVTSGNLERKPLLRAFLLEGCPQLVRSYRDRRSLNGRGGADGPVAGAARWCRGRRPDPSRSAWRMRLQAGPQWR